MKPRTKKLLSLLVTFAMLIGMMPMVYAEEDASGGVSPHDDVEVVDSNDHYTVAKVGTETYETLDAAITAAKEAAKEDEISSADIQLTADAELGAVTFGDAGIEIDINLAGHTLTLTESDNTAVKVENGAVLAIYGGKIDANSYKESNIGVMVVNTASSLWLQDVEMTTNAAAVYGCGDSAMVIIQDSSITAATYAITTNAGSASNYNPVFAVSNSTLSGSSPVLVNVPCQLTLEKTSVNGRMHALGRNHGGSQEDGVSVPSGRNLWPARPCQPNNLW